MKKLTLYLLAAIMTIAVGCEKFDDSAIWDKLNSFESRLVALEQLCSQMNTNISSLQSVVTALQNNDYVTNIAPINEGDKIIGYTITFSKSGSITIYHGKDGTNGIDGVTPKIGVKKANDEIYYWTINGDWLLDDDGNKIKAEGATSKDGITPKLKIEKEYWYVSYDNGSTWTKLGKATSESSDKDELITNVTYDNEYVYITLADGTKLAVPRNNKNSNNNEANVPKNQIWYTSTDGKIITPNDSSVFGASIVSNIYDNGKGVITFKKDITTIGKRAFYECDNLLEIFIPNSVEEIGESAFGYCASLVNITIPDGVTAIGRYAFLQCDNLTEIIIPKSVYNIEEGVFSYCDKLKEIIIPKNVTSIKRATFSDCPNLVDVNISDSVTSIENFAFQHCTSIKSITIPKSVTMIGTGVFNGCSNLNTVICKPTIPPTLGEPIPNYTFDLKIYVPFDSVDSYKNATNWIDNADMIFPSNI